MDNQTIGYTVLADRLSPNFKLFGKAKQGIRSICGENNLEIVFNTGWFLTVSYNFNVLHPENKVLLIYLNNLINLMMLLSHSAQRLKYSTHSTGTVLNSSNGTILIFYVSFWCSAALCSLRLASQLGPSKCTATLTELVHKLELHTCAHRSPGGPGRQKYIWNGPGIAGLF